MPHQSRSSPAIIGGVKITVYYIPGSHPCNAVFKALQLKELGYRKSVVIPPAHRLQMKLMFGRRTVPAMKLVGDDGSVEKIQTSRAIMRTLDSLKPQPALYPSDPDARRRVIDAEDWADGNFQDVGRRLIWAHLKRAPEAMLSFSGPGDRIPLPRVAQRLAAGPVTAIQAKLNGATDERVRDDIAKLPEMLDRIDGWIASGTIGGESPNAADLLIASTLRLWMSMDDIAAAINSRPCGDLALRLFPNVAGHVHGGVLPSAWLAPLRPS